MEIKLCDPYFPAKFNDGLDTPGDTEGVILDVPIICGECMVNMKKVNDNTYSCPRCNAVFRKYG